VIPFRCAPYSHDVTECRRARDCESVVLRASRWSACVRDGVAY